MELWLKALHIIAVIAWMAGMLYLPRLFVYHADAPVGSAMSETFKIMERRLLKTIVNPSMVLVFLTGPILAYVTGYWQAPWLQLNSPSRSASARCTDISRGASGCLRRTPMNGRRGFFAF